MVAQSRATAPRPNPLIPAIGIDLRIHVSRPGQSSSNLECVMTVISLRQMGGWTPQTRPDLPEPIWCAVTESFHAQQIQDKLVMGTKK